MKGAALSLELNGVPKLSITNTGFVPGGPGVLIGIGMGRAVHRVFKSSCIRSRSP